MNDVAASQPGKLNEGTKSGECSSTQSLIQRQLFKTLRNLKHGCLSLNQGKQAWSFGAVAEDGLNAAIEVHDPQLYRHLALGGSLGAAEAYLRGDWSADDLTTVLRIMCRNLDSLSSMDSGLARIGLWFAKLAHQWSANSKAGSQRNIAAHYDLSNEFFELFLDPSWMYSSALFESEQQSLEEASLHKMEAICQQLQLGPDDHLVEIGTGWGGFAIHAATNYGCQITTTTISKQQFEKAQQRVAAAGLNDRIQLLMTDYRDLEGTYDKLVSIEMIEAVGHQFLPEYFSVCDRLLRPGGTMLVQAITMPDQRYAQYLKSADFIQKYIFPGGHLPSVGEMQRCQNAATRLRLVKAHQFPDSYALTLRNWRRRFFDKIDTVRELGFDERFIRMWEYYFCYCEAAFLERAVSVGQFVWEKSRY